MMGAAESISDLRSLLSIVAEETGALKMNDADEDGVGWTTEGPLPMTFGHVRRAHAALAALEAALSAAEPVKTSFEVALKHIPEGRASLLSRAISQGLNDYGWKNFGTLPEVLMGYIVKAERSEADMHPPQPAPSVAVKELQWDDDGDNLKARMGDREWMLNITSGGKTWAGSTRPFVFGRNLTWSSVPNCSMVSLEAAKAACQADCQSRYTALSAQVQDAEEQRTGTCERCQGNGEIVTDWERYRHPHENDAGDEAVAECPDCDGIGKVSAQVQDVVGWQPIETAPKDGTTFLAIMAKAYSPRATLCKVEDGKFFSPSQGEKFVVPGWNQWWPTHWMPLPAAPAKQEGGE